MSLDAHIRRQLAALPGHSRPEPEKIVAALPANLTNTEAKRNAALTRCREIIDTYSADGTSTRASIPAPVAPKILRTPIPVDHDADLFLHWAAKSASIVEFVKTCRLLFKTVGLAGPSRPLQERRKARDVLERLVPAGPYRSDNDFFEALWGVLTSTISLGTMFPHLDAVREQVRQVFTEIEVPADSESIVEELLHQIGMAARTRAVQDALQDFLDRVQARMGDGAHLGQALLTEAQRVARRLATQSHDAAITVTQFQHAMSQVGVCVVFEPVFDRPEQPWTIDATLAKPGDATDRICIRAMTSNWIVLDGPAPLSAHALHGLSDGHEHDLQVLLGGALPATIAELAVHEVNRCLDAIDEVSGTVPEKLLPLLQRHMQLETWARDASPHAPVLESYLSNSASHLLTQLGALGLGLKPAADANPSSADSGFEPLLDADQLPLIEPESDQGQELAFRLMLDPEVRQEWEEEARSRHIVTWWLNSGRYPQAGELARLVSPTHIAALKKHVASEVLPEIEQLVRSTGAHGTPADIMERAAKLFASTLSESPQRCGFELQAAWEVFSAFGVALRFDHVSDMDVPGGYRWEATTQRKDASSSEHAPPYWLALCAKVLREPEMRGSLGPVTSVRKLVAQFATEETSAGQVAAIVAFTFDPKTQHRMEPIDSWFNRIDLDPNSLLSEKLVGMCADLHELHRNAATLRRIDEDTHADEVQARFDAHEALLRKIGFVLYRDRWVIEPARSNSGVYAALEKRLTSLRPYKEAWEQAGVAEDIVTWFREQRGTMSDYFVVAFLEDDVRKPPRWLLRLSS